MDLTRPSDLKPLLERYGLALQKRFGQNFLISRPHLEKVVQAAAPGPEDTVLEIGPGAGALTAELAERAGRVVAIELDKALLPLLTELFAESAHVQILSGDALKMELAPLGASKVAANIPYNITSPLLIKLLSHRPAFESVTLMVQKEVARRLVAAPDTPEWGALSVFVQWHASATLIATVPRGAFLPPPRVDSAIVHLIPHAAPPYDADEKAFLAVSRAAFGQRRKTLANALAAGLSREREGIEAALRSVGVDPIRRGETLTLAEIAEISRALFDSGAS